MPRFPKVSKRELVVIAIMLSLFYGLLGYMYSVGRISILGITLITVAGVITVGGSVLLYSQMWDDSD